MYTNQMGAAMSFVDLLRIGRERIQQEADTQPAKGAAAAPPWHRTITRFHGRRTATGEEWITAGEVFDALAIPVPARPSLARKVAAIMRGEGWRAAMVGPRSLRQRGYVRGPPALILPPEK